MGALISVSILGKDKLLAGLAAFADSAKDVRPFWRDVFAPRYFAQIQDRFALEGQSRGTGGRFGGGHWAPLSKRYKGWKDAHFPGKTILDRTGRLRRSLTWSGTRLGPGGVFDAQPTYALAGTRVPYGGYHQTGTDRMPARPFLDPPDPTVFAPLLKAWIVRSGKAKKKA